MPRIRNTADGPRAVRTIPEEQRKQNRMTQFSPLSDDGPLTKAKLAEIHSILATVKGDDPRVNAEEACADKIATWRREIKTARYQDW